MIGLVKRLWKSWRIGRHLNYLKKVYLKDNAVFHRLLNYQDRKRTASYYSQYKNKRVLSQLHLGVFVIDYSPFGNSIGFVVYREETSAGQNDSYVNWEADFTRDPNLSMLDDYLTSFVKKVERELRAIEAERAKSKMLLKKRANEKFQEVMDSKGLPFESEGK